MGKIVNCEKMCWQKAIIVELFSLIPKQKNTLYLKEKRNPN